MQVESLQELLVAMKLQLASVHVVFSSAKTVNKLTVPTGIDRVTVHDLLHAQRRHVTGGNRPSTFVVEFVGHLLRDGDSCGAADKSIITNNALVNPAVTETLLHETRGISNIPCSAPQTVPSTTRERNQCRRKGSRSPWSLA